MDKSKLNDAQQVVVDTLPGPLFVAAGAGSGKTFTLKLRTANAFLQNQSGFKLDSIDEVLAITYTEKAAEELLSRIKATLFEEGLEQPAKDADTAWISTIHGFCSRLLRENALELGMDPEFQMVTEKEASDIYLEAQERIAFKVRSGKIKLPDIDLDVNLFGKGFSTGLFDNADSLISKTQAMPNGLDSLVSEFDGCDQASQLESLISAAEEVLEAGRGWGNSVHKSWELPKIEALPNAISLANTVLGNQGGTLGYLEALGAFPVLTKSFGKKKDGQDAIERYREAHAKATYDVCGLMGDKVVDAAKILAEELMAETSALKRELGLVDNDDLIRLALRALAEHPHIAKHYQRQFKLIMVDEFQDTNKAQIEIVRLIAQPNMTNVCVVGDAQQSIYRFRGADLGSFTDYQKEMSSTFPDIPEGKLQPKLKQNFRSHPDILHFVDKVFGQEDSFGDAYLKLEPMGAIKDENDPVMSRRARVAVDVAHYQRGTDLDAQALRKSAMRIAKHFAQLRQDYEAQSKSSQDDKDSGHRRQTYALLLGRTANAGIYMDALREVGLDSMMTSGSILLATDEAKMLLALLKLAVNINDEKPLLTVLTSPLFSISDDALLAMSRFRLGNGRYAGLAGGFACKEDPAAMGLLEEDSTSLRIARQVLKNFSIRARRESVTEAVRSVLVESGYMDRASKMDVSGLASAGNFSKLMEMLKKAEDASSGIASTVAAYEIEAENAKASPGVLSVEESDFVQIMTIHGSKGLQFDHVVVADIQNGKHRSGDFLVETSGDFVYAMSHKGLSVKDNHKEWMLKNAHSRGVESLRDAQTKGDAFLLLQETFKRETMAEARRLLYVGLTRAVRSVYLAYVTSAPPVPNKGEPYESDGVMREVYTAMEWDVDQSKMVDVESCEYGGSMPAKVVFENLTQDSEEDGEEGLRQNEEEGAAPKFEIPVRDVLKQPLQIRFKRARQNVRSYSSLSHEAPGAMGGSSESPEPDKTKGAMEPASQSAIFDEEAQVEQDLEREPAEDPTNLGTAFHRLAQISILEKNASGSNQLNPPEQATIKAQESKMNLSREQMRNLHLALENWFSSDLAKKICTYDSLSAEVPFMVDITDSNGDPLFLEGEIDALATSGDNAFIVDYKTGGSAEETPEEIANKHRLQALCYAYALMRNGFESVVATFVRVQQKDENGQPQTVRYEFDRDELQRLEAEILSRWE